MNHATKSGGEGVREERSHRPPLNERGASTRTTEISSSRLKILHSRGGGNHRRSTKGFVCAKKFSPSLEPKEKNSVGHRSRRPFEKEHEK